MIIIKTTTKYSIRFTSRLAAWAQCIGYMLLSLFCSLIGILFLVLGLCRGAIKNTNEIQEVSGGAGGIRGAFIGNTYYESRLLRKGSSNATAGGSLQTGDLLIELEDSPLPQMIGKQRVDTAGFETSYLKAKGRTARAMMPLTEVVDNMHLHDGSSVPEVCRGDVPTGRLSVRGVYVGRHARRVGLHPPTFPVRNAALLFSRSSMNVTSREEGVALLGAVVERCRSMGRSYVLRPVCDEHRGASDTPQIRYLLLGACTLG
eukprot:gene4308-3123_t